jgi:two-component system response regulator YesN
MYDNFKDADCATFQAFDINNTADCNSAFIETEITKLCNLLTKKYLGSFFLPTETSQIFSIFTSSNLKSEKIFYEKIRLLESEIQDFLNSNLSAIGTFIYGSIFDNLSNLYLSYQEAQKTKNSQINCALHDVKHYIEIHYQEPHLTLVQIADYFNINHCYLTSLYKNKFGINLYDYLIQVRMEKAGEFLHTTNLKSYQIAEKVGYSNSQYFSLSFKKYFSCTTTEYKNQNVKRGEINGS